MEVAHHFLMQHFLGGLGEEGDWVVVGDGSFQGSTILADNTGNVIFMSTRHCNDSYRWSEMPSLSQFKSLIFLDLHKSRYITAIDDSLGELDRLQHLHATRCSNLRSLPPSIGNLVNLVEVRLFYLRSFLSVFFPFPGKRQV